jgi:hypothetical protein
MCGQVKPAPKTVLQGDDGKPSLADAVGGLVRATVEREHEVLPVLVMGQEARLEASEHSSFLADAIAVCGGASIIYFTAS